MRLLSPLAEQRGDLRILFLFPNISVVIFGDGNVFDASDSGMVEPPQSYSFFISTWKESVRWRVAVLSPGRDRSKLQRRLRCR